MAWNVFFWIDALIALFFCCLLLIDAFKYKLRLFTILSFFYFVVLLKSLLYVAMGLGVFLSTNDPKINLYYFIFQAAELLYTTMIFYLMSSTQRIAIEKRIRGVAVFSLCMALAGIIFAAVIGYLSVKYGDSSYQTKIDAVEILKTWLGNWIFIAAKLILIIFAWGAVRRMSIGISGHVKIVATYSGIIYFFFVIEIAYNVLSVLNYYQRPIWFSLQCISIILFSFFAFGVHSGYVESLKERILSLIKERDSLIQLMKEISVVVGGEEFELETVIKIIVDNSVKVTNARGGVLLLKDKITNRLSVSYIKGLYPPTKTLKNIQNVTVTENIIIEKLKAEKIAIGEGLLGEVAETGEAIYIPDVVKDERFIQTVSDHILVTSFLAVPLKTKEDVFGVLSVVDDSKFFQENDLSLLETLGEQAAITITQIQMYQEVLEKKQAEKELGVAGEIQASLIPHSFPQSDKFEIFGFSIPAKGVGGDYYDYIDFGSNKVALTMFDVSGKGVPAALIMVMIRSILRTVATLNEDTKDVIARLNNTIAEEIVEDRYATGFYLLFDAEKGIMSYTNAGHGPLILFRANTDEFEFLDTEGMPIGIMSDIDYGQNYTILERGDIAILYTDGISEAMNQLHEEFGLERFKDVIRNNKKDGAREICNRVLEAVTTFCGTAPQHDDETLLVLKSR